ncbi:AAA family ATPase [Rhizobium sp. BJ04]|uniref:TrlF family AAA-like ATPase n=1 Tax=Rhizobium binxianense TaxID=3024242 RepID=UPI0023A92A2D|nr:AAA family ATPase [Rhizobium sp. BJ04]WEA58647.1 AAA family ATPase [Rhizobium sp. BJ04]
MSVAQHSSNQNAVTQRGSVWRKWDLHIHAPGTKLANAFGPADDIVWAEFINQLEASEVQAFGITDYFSFDTYLQARSSYERLVPGGGKLLIPNIEFRLTETVSADGKNVNTHVLIDPDAATEDALGKFLNDLQTHISVRGHETRLRCSELKPEHYAAATVSIYDIKKALRESFTPEQFLIVTAAGNDGLRGAAKNSQRSKSISDELDRSSHAFFGKSGSTAYFLGTDRYEDDQDSDPKPLFDGSDAHSFADLARLTGDEPNFQSTWVKADLSFRGLRQTVFEPAHRVYIGDKPPVLIRSEREATRFIERLEITHANSYDGRNGTWFRDVNIPFNPELTAIIGNKGSGKSALADIVALLGNTRQAKHFSFLTDSPSNKKFKRPGYAEHFTARMTWKNGSSTEKLLSGDPDVLKPEAVKYLPQNYFESLTNEIEVQELRREIEDVVFSHVDPADRIDAATFRELEDRKTSASRQEASQLKARLRELNMKIIDLEEQSTPAHRASLVAQLENLQSRLSVLEASKPPEESEPLAETPEQIAISGRIAKLTTLVAELETREKDAHTRQAALKKELQDLAELTEQVSSIKSRVDADKLAIVEKYAFLGLDIDATIDVSIDLTAVEARTQEIATAISALEIDSTVAFGDDTDMSVLTSIPDLRSAIEFISAEITSRRTALSAPLQRYQKYTQALKEIEGQISEIVGDRLAPVPGTFADLEARIKRIDEQLLDELSRAYKERHELSAAIFECKKKIKTFYEDLKSKVEARLASVSTGDFKVSIDASFVQSPKFADEFFGHLNQNVQGPFRGVAEGDSELRRRLAGVDWNSLDSILTFVDGIISAMKGHDAKRQAKDLKKLYDFIYSFEYFEARYELRLGGKDLNQLSPGEKGLLLLVFYLHLDMDNTPLIIDQPEDNLDNDSIFAVLAKCIREAKKSRQVILVTHNPNLAVGADAEQIVYVRLDKVNGYKFSYESGSIENPNTNGHVVKVLEGSRPAFVQRRLKYHIV